jgi:hypothetical protein
LHHRHFVASKLHTKPLFDNLSTAASQKYNVSNDKLFFFILEIASKFNIYSERSIIFFSNIFIASRINQHTVANVLISNFLATDNAFSLNFKSVYHPLKFSLKHLPSHPSPTLLK